MMDQLFSACVPPPLRVTEMPQQLLYLPPLTVASQPSSPFAQPLAMVACRPTTPSFIKKQYHVIKKKQVCPKQWQQHQQRRVRFHQSLVTKRVEPTPEAASYNPWWSDRSLRKIQKHNKLIARHYQQKKNILFCHAIERFMETTTTTTTRDNSNNRHYVNIVLKTSSQTRGLERLIVPSVAASRRRATKAVLQVQHRLRQAGVLRQGTKNGNTDMAAQLLRQTSLAHSQPCRQLALRLAQIDEWEVKQLNDDKKKDDADIIICIDD